MAEFQSFRRLCWASGITRETNDQNSAHWAGLNGPAPARPWEDATRCSPLRRGYWRAGSGILDRAIVHHVNRARDVANRSRTSRPTSLK